MYAWCLPPYKHTYMYADVHLRTRTPQSQVNPSGTKPLNLSTSLERLIIQAVKEPQRNLFSGSWLGAPNHCVSCGALSQVEPHSHGFASYRF